MRSPVICIIRRVSRDFFRGGFCRPFSVCSSQSAAIRSHCKSCLRYAFPSLRCTLRIFAVPSLFFIRPCLSYLCYAFADRSKAFRRLPFRCPFVARPLQSKSSHFEAIPLLNCATQCSSFALPSKPCQSFAKMFQAMQCLCYSARSQAIPSLFVARQRCAFTLLFNAKLSHSFAVRCKAALRFSFAIPRLAFASLLYAAPRVSFAPPRLSIPLPVDSLR